MLSVFRPDFEVVREGRILYFVSGYRRFKSFLRIGLSYIITTRPHQFDPGRFWDILSGCERKRMAKDDLSPETLKHLIMTIFK
jgi:hypothetical protein